MVFVEPLPVVCDQYQLQLPQLGRLGLSLSATTHSNNAAVSMPCRLPQFPRGVPDPAEYLYSGEPCPKSSPSGIATAANFSPR